MTGVFPMKVLVRGAGEMASGVGSILHRAGFQVAFTEIDAPMCVRRTVSFCEALWRGRARVEDLEAVLAGSPAEVKSAWNQNLMSVLVDPDLTCLPDLNPDILVDATLAKKNLGLHMDMAPLTIGLGPGFCAGRDAHIVVETNRGHNLGRLILQGEAEPNTGSPGVIAGESLKRVLRAPADGVVETDLDIGVSVEKGMEVLRISGIPLYTALGGVLRGLIRPGSRVVKGLKVGDVDPRGDLGYCYTISDKARAVGGAVLTATLSRLNR